MTDSTQPALTVGDVYHLGGWDTRYARVLALASADGYAVSITDGNSDHRDVETELWHWQGDAWHPAKGEGGHYSVKGKLRIRVKDIEIHASFALDETEDAPAESATRVGNMSVIARPIYRGA